MATSLTTDPLNVTALPAQSLPEPAREETSASLVEAPVPPVVPEPDHHEDEAHDDIAPLASSSGVSNGPTETFVDDHQQPSSPPAAKKGGKHDDLPPEKQRGVVFEYMEKVFGRYSSLKMAGTICSMYIAFMSFTYVGSGGLFGGVRENDRLNIIDTNIPENNDRGIILTNGRERAIISTTAFQVVLIGLARASAYFMYPCLVMVYVTKFRATMEFISHTPFSLFTNDDLHDMHVYCGWTILIFATMHSIFHLIRWGVQGNLNLVFEHYSGLSGFLVLISTFVCCIPMIWLVKRMQYEIRKALHYFFIIFATALAFHSPFTAWPRGGWAPIIFPTLIGWYVLDYLFCMLLMTEKIETPVFHVVPTGVQLTMQVSDRFNKTEAHGGYCYINFPWISKSEWHAYSLFENASNPEEHQIYIQILGNWTDKVHKALQRSTARPVWVQGPFASPYNSAVNYDDQILVAGGIGITPALSVMRADKASRRSNLIWAVRDPHMLEFFIKNGDFSNRGWNMIFYTGKETIIGLEGEVIASNGVRVHVIRSRPDFAKIVPNLVYSIESGAAVPEAYVPDAKIEAVIKMKNKLHELDMNHEMSDSEKVSIMINEVQASGFLFTELAEQFLGVHVSKNMLQKSNRQSMALSSHFLNTIRNHDSQQSIGWNSSLSSRTFHTHADVGSMRKLLSKQKKQASTRSQSQFHNLWGEMTAHAATDHEANPENFKPWLADPGAAIDFVHNLDDSVKKTWGMLYCGGKSPLAVAARKAAEEYGIEHHFESFAW